MNSSLKIESTGYYIIVENVYKNTDVNDVIDEDCIDISIFTLEEWKKIKKIGDIFASNARCLSSDSDEGYSLASSQYKENAYWLYYRGFPTGFNHNSFDGCYDIFGYKLSKILTKFSQKHSDYTLNKFRQWVCKNYDEMNRRTACPP